MNNLIRDIRYGIRSLLRDKAFAATVLLTLAICIAANTATFAIVNSVIFRPLPIPQAEKIVIMSNQYPKAGTSTSTNSAAADYYDRLTAVTALSHQAMYQTGGRTPEIGGRPEQVQGMAVTPTFFPLVGVSPARGRAFTPEEGEIGGEQKVILSDGLWHSLFAGDPAAVGHDIRIGGRPFTIVGIMPRGFNFVDSEVRYWVPLAFTAQQKTARHNNNWTNIGRLKPGATISQAQSQVDALNAANLDRFPSFRELLINAGFHTTADGLQHSIVKDVEPVLYLLWGGAAFVLLIGTFNLINVALARLALRRKEIATRVALGGGRMQLLRQLVVENLMIALVAGVAGVLLGAGVLRALTVVHFDRFPRADEVHIDATVIAAALALSALVGGVIGALQMASVVRMNVSGVLHDASRTGTSGTGARRLRQTLVASQIGFAFVLLAGAGLLLSSFRNLLAVDPGYTADRVLTASTLAPRATYMSDESQRNLAKRSLESIRAIPGVTSAGVTTDIPFGGNYSDSVILAENYTMKPGESLVSPHQLSVTPGYLETMKIGLVRGRYFTQADNESAPGAVIVDETLASHFWKDRDPIGQRLRMPDDSADLMKVTPKTRWFTVVGVVRPVRLEDLSGVGNSAGAYYFPWAQQPSRGLTFAIRTSMASSAIERAARTELARIDPDLALFDIKTMSERMELSLSSRRASMSLALGFGATALFLSVIGIYGVLAHLVTQRRREIGIRIALGSTGGGIVRLVFREGVILVTGGIVLGVAGAAALRQVIAGQVYGVQPLDPGVLTIVVALFALVGLGACVMPARRALSVDPALVLTE